VAVIQSSLQSIISQCKMCRLSADAGAPAP